MLCAAVQGRRVCICVYIHTHTAAVETLTAPRASARLIPPSRLPRARAVQCRLRTVCLADKKKRGQVCGIAGVIASSLRLPAHNAKAGRTQRGRGRQAAEVAARARITMGVPLPPPRQARRTCLRVYIHIYLCAIDTCTYASRHEHHPAGGSFFLCTPCRADACSILAVVI